LSFGNRRNRYPHGEGRSLSESVTVCGHGTAMQLDDVAHDREPEAEPTFAARRGGIRLAEAIEDERQERRIDSLPAVGKFDHGVAVAALGADLDPAALGGELHRV